MSLLKNGRSEEKEVDVVLGEVASSKNEGPPFLCKVSCYKPLCNFSKYSLAACNFSNLNGRKKKRGGCCAL